MHQPQRQPFIIVLVSALLLATFVVAQNLPRGTNGNSGNNNSNASPTLTPTQTPVSTPTPNPPASVPARPTARNLAQYATVGPFNLRDEVTPAARRQVMSQLRSFVWDKWQAKQRGRVSHVSTLIRGYAPGTTQFFVEPDESGKWRVTIETQGQEVAQHYYGVEEVVVDADGLPLDAHEAERNVRGATRALQLTPGTKGNAAQGLIF